MILEQGGVDAVIRYLAHFFRCGCPALNHQADNLAKLRHEFLPVIKLIAKIFGAVSKIKINAIKERHAFLRAVRKLALIFI